MTTEQVFLTIAPLPLGEMVLAGKYDDVHGISAERFPTTDEDAGEWEFRCFRFKRAITSDEATSLITKEDQTDPWQPAGIVQQLKYGSAFPEEQTDNPIIALGSVCLALGGRPHVPMLSSLGTERRLGIIKLDCKFTSRCRFLAVRRRSA